MRPSLYCACCCRLTCVFDTEARACRTCSRGRCTRVRPAQLSAASPLTLCLLGEFLLNLLNYSGLIVNGLVAFILPLLLTLQATRLFKSRASNTPPLGPPQPCLEGTYLLAEQEHTDPPHDSDGHDNGNGEEFARLVPLPAFLVPHRTEIIIVIIASYIAIILSTIVSNAVDFFENYF